MIAVTVLVTGLMLKIMTMKLILISHHIGHFHFKAPKTFKVGVKLQKIMTKTRMAVLRSEMLTKV